MGKNLVRKMFTNSDEWVAPAGVTHVKIKAVNKQINVCASASLLGTDAEAQSYALDYQGAMYSWGQGFDGELGDGTDGRKSTPELVSGSHKFKQVSASGDHTLALRDDGRVLSWGGNTIGALGDNSVAAKSTPVLVSGPADRLFKHINAYGFDNSAAITTRGQLYTWGANGQGQLGQNNTTHRSSPVLVSLGLPTNTHFKQASIMNHALAITDTGELYSWGRNVDGELGLGDTVTTSTPNLVSGVLFKHVTCGAQTASFTDSYSLGVSLNGDLYAWGSDPNGLRFGDATAGVKHSTPTLVVAGLKLKEVYASRDDVAALTEDGSLYTWGLNTFGVLGHGDTTPRSTPILVSGFKFTQVSLAQMVREVAGGRAGHMIAARSDGQILTWGGNQVGALGLNDIADRSTPTVVALPNSIIWDTNPDKGNNTSIVSVTPGVTYAVRLNGSNTHLPSFGPYALNTNPLLPTILELEYWA